MNARSSLASELLLVASLVGVALPGRASAADCEVNGILAKVVAQDEAGVGDPVVVVMSILNETDRNFDIRSNLSGNPYIPAGGLLGSVGQSTLGNPLYWGPGVDLLFNGNVTIGRHSEAIVGYGRAPVYYSEPGAYTVNASFTKNQFQAVLQDRDNPLCQIQLSGGSMKLIRVLRKVR